MDHIINELPEYDSDDLLKLSFIIKEIWIVDNIRLFDLYESRLSQVFEKFDVYEKANILSYNLKSNNGRGILSWKFIEDIFNQFKNNKSL